jgi:NAD(P)H-dependent FMN reductase
MLFEIMTKRILAFGASNSKRSINKRLAEFAANQLEDVAVDLLDLNDFEMPIFSTDKEEIGIPERAHAFKSHIEQADGIVISLAEHNGSFTAAYKNLYDWVSRIDVHVWMKKPMFLLATSPGGRGGKSVLSHAASLYGFQNKRDIPTFSLPYFHTNFSEEGITDNVLNAQFSSALDAFELQLRNVMV